MGLAAQEALKQPTWCRLSPDKYPVLEARAHATFPENLLFTYKNPAAGAAAGSAGVDPGQHSVAGNSAATKAATVERDGSETRPLITAAATAVARRRREAREVDPVDQADPSSRSSAATKTARQSSSVGSEKHLSAAGALAPGSTALGSAAVERR